MNLMTWRDIAIVAPDFVQWVVQTHGPRSDDPVTEAEYVEMAAAYAERE